MFPGHLEDCGLEEAVSLAMQPINGSLVHAIAERWNPRTNTFWFPWGEMTITLDEFSNIMGLPEPKDSIEGCVFALQAWFYKHVGPQSCHFQNTNGQLSSMEHYCRKMEEVDDSTIIWDFFDRQVIKSRYTYNPIRGSLLLGPFFIVEYHPEHCLRQLSLRQRKTYPIESEGAIVECELDTEEWSGLYTYAQQRWESFAHLYLVLGPGMGPEYVKWSLISNAPIKSFIDLTERAECIEAGIENGAFDAVIPVEVREDTKKNSRSQNAPANIVANATIFKKEKSEYPKNKGVMDRANGSSSGSKNKHPGWGSSMRRHKKKPCDLKDLGKMLEKAIKQNELSNELEESVVVPLVQSSAGMGGHMTYAYTVKLKSNP
ncbi:hypothetical protein EJ110_NYTH28569 [Nymphaea thermarum]|nr:hypothetical protein EJ110_NYTH28569 [Nymphaea thermarum]